ncbi:hypothetical protein L198_00543 [Cryptococcus wingfieldii CBS 7118]|uniref:Uncharacterized protein n=1 Tax=Cryptococcus wingfieldii CBS 7118 TaxID=1295528 RepID=A0A1E3K6N9_9TREE|nr:hypothetical protein L198_00543 [Cryptococcus wingfieldii CBS 7118]ODO08810.1 hypothetical protein L198_00543 [Cryptococcus wingfieldii CBS 7118]
MAELTPDAISDTPLDLLINAIAGNHTHHENIDQYLLPASDYVSSKRSRPDDIYDPPRPLKLARTAGATASLSSFFALHHEEGHTIDSAHASHVNTVEVWHPTTGQKSYGKERRMLNPPPIVRFTGSLAHRVIAATMSAYTSPPNQPPAISGTNTLRLGDLSSPTSGLLLAQNQKHPNWRRQKLRYAALNAGFGGALTTSRSTADIKDRFLLKEGVTFPGIWIGENTGKMKEFNLELKIFLGSDDPAEDGQEHHAEERTSTMYEAPHPSNSAEALSEILEPDSGSHHPLVETIQNSESGLGHDAIHSDHPEAESSGSLQEPEPSRQHQDTGSQEGPLQPPEEQLLGTFTSPSLRIVSKPSTKTSKARSMATCFSHDSAFSLWTRLHGQTVRTRWMNLEEKFNQDGPRLTARTAKWTPFRFEILDRAPFTRLARTSRGRPVNNEYTDATKLTYGSTVLLVDLQTGVKSDPVKLVKIEQGKYVVGGDVGQPVSELQRVGLVRAVSGEEEGGSRWYLSAPGARVGGAELFKDSSLGIRARVKPGRKSKGDGKQNPGEQPLAPSFMQDEHNDVNDLGGLGGRTLEESITLSDPSSSVDQPASSSEDANADAETPQSISAKSLNARRTALAAAVLAENEEGATQKLLSWAKAERKEELVRIEEEDGEGEVREVERRVHVDSVADWMSWTIGGVCK